MAVASTRIAELLIDFATNRCEDLLPYTQFPGVTPPAYNLCLAYEDVCGRMLDHVQCPLAERVVRGCSNTSDYGTWIATCSCYGAYTPASLRSESFRA